MYHDFAQVPGNNRVIGNLKIHIDGYGVYHACGLLPDGP
jgi:hypothetical protein